MNKKIYIIFVQNLIAITAHTQVRTDKKIAKCGPAAQISSNQESFVIQVHAASPYKKATTQKFAGTDIKVDSPAATRHPDMNPGL